MLWRDPSRRPSHLQEPPDDRRRRRLARYPCPSRRHPPLPLSRHRALSLATRVVRLTLLEECLHAFLVVTGPPRLALKILLVRHRLFEIEAERMVEAALREADRAGRHRGEPARDLFRLRHQ